MAQLLVRQLALAKKEVLRRRAKRHGRSMEEETRLILRQALASDEDATPQRQGLGSWIAALFSNAGTEKPIADLQGETATAALFET